MTKLIDEVLEQAKLMEAIDKKACKYSFRYRMAKALLAVDRQSKEEAVADKPFEHQRGWNAAMFLIRKAMEQADDQS